MHCAGLVDVIQGPAVALDQTGTTTGTLVARSRNLSGQAREAPYYFVPVEDRDTNLMEPPPLNRSYKLRAPLDDEVCRMRRTRRSTPTGTD